jgi:hypothetical protein
MTMNSRSSVLLVGCLALHGAASAQALTPSGVRAAAVPTELLVEDARWLPAIQGAIPPGSIAHGRERDGRPQYICRATHDGGLHLGKVSPGSAGCIMVVRDQAVVRGSYEVLTEVAAAGQDAVASAASRRSRWGRTESVVELIRRRRAESGGSQKRVNQ